MLMNAMIEQCIGEYYPGRQHTINAVRSVRRCSPGETAAVTEVARQDSRDVLVEPHTDAGARAAGVLCRTAGTTDVIDASSG